jgi:hypothetical protein
MRNVFGACSAIKLVTKIKITFQASLFYIQSMHLTFGSNLIENKIFLSFSNNNNNNNKWDDTHLFSILKLILNSVNSLRHRFADLRDCPKMLFCKSDPLFRKRWQVLDKSKNFSFSLSLSLSLSLQKTFFPLQSL